MPIEVVERGEWWGDKIHEDRCGSCKSLLRWKAADVPLVTDTMYGDFFQFRCPVCCDFVKSRVHKPGKPRV